MINNNPKNASNLKHISELLLGSIGNLLHKETSEQAAAASSNVVEGLQTKTQAKETIQVQAGHLKGAKETIQVQEDHLKDFVEESEACGEEVHFKYSRDRSSYYLNGRQWRYVDKLPEEPHKKNDYSEEEVVNYLQGRIEGKRYHPAQVRIAIVNYIVWYAGNKSKFLISHAKIAAQCGCSIRYVGTVLRALEELGFLMVWKQFNNVSIYSMADELSYANIQQRLIPYIQAFKGYLAVIMLFSTMYFNPTLSARPNPVSSQGIFNQFKAKVPNRDINVSLTNQLDFDNNTTLYDSVKFDSNRVKFDNYSFEDFDYNDKLSAYNEIDNSVGTRRGEEDLKEDATKLEHVGIKERVNRFACEQRESVSREEDSLFTLTTACDKSLHRCSSTYKENGAKKSESHLFTKDKDVFDKCFEEEAITHSIVPMAPRAPQPPKGCQPPQAPQRSDHYPHLCPEGQYLALWASIAPDKTAHWATIPQCVMREILLRVYCKMRHLRGNSVVSKAKFIAAAMKEVCQRHNVVLDYHYIQSVIGYYKLSKALTYQQQSCAMARFKKFSSDLDVVYNNVEQNIIHALQQQKEQQRIAKLKALSHATPNATVQSHKEPHNKPLSSSFKENIDASYIHDKQTPDDLASKKLEFNEFLEGAVNCVKFMGLDFVENLAAEFSDVAPVGFSFRDWYNNNK